MSVGDRLRDVAHQAAVWLDPELGRYAPLKPFLLEAVPDDLERLDADAFVPASAQFGSGVDLREDEQLHLLCGWQDRFGSLFETLRADPQINTQAHGKPYLHNGWYPTPDAEVYAAMIADRQPTRIVEIGAGYSTRIARRVINELGLATELVVVDPDPRAEVSNYADTLLQKRVEEIAPDALPPVDGRTILFVDSSHIVRAGGDVPLLFCWLIPSLPVGVLVHVHDVFLPYDYPPAYRRRLYGEAYVLWALLARGSRCQTVFATHLMVRTQREEMQRVFGPIVGTDSRYYGASFWFELM